MNKKIVLFFIVIFFTVNHTHTMDITETQPKRRKKLIHTKNTGIRSPLHKAKKTLTSCIEKKEKQSSAYQEYSSLVWNIQKNNPEFTKIFLEHEKEVNRQGINGNTPLHFAVAAWAESLAENNPTTNSRFAIIMSLIEYPRIRSASILNNDGKTPQSLIPKNDNPQARMLSGILFGRANFEKSVTIIITATLLQKDPQDITFSDITTIQNHITLNNIRKLSYDNLIDDILKYKDKDFINQNNTSDRQMPEFIQKTQAYIDEDFVRASIVSWIEDNIDPNHNNVLLEEYKNNTL